MPKQHIRRGKEGRARRQITAESNAEIRAGRTVLDQFEVLSRRVGDSKRERSRLWPGYDLGF